MFTHHILMFLGLVYNYGERCRCVFVIHTHLLQKPQSKPNRERVERFKLILLLNAYT